MSAVLLSNFALTIPSTQSALLNFSQKYVLQHQYLFPEYFNGHFQSILLCMRIFFFPQTFLRIFQHLIYFYLPATQSHEISK